MNRTLLHDLTDREVTFQRVIACLEDGVAMTFRYLLSDYKLFEFTTQSPFKEAQKTLLPSLAQIGPSASINGKTNLLLSSLSIES